MIAERSVRETARGPATPEPQPAVLVTGASTGIGYATALRLARKNVVVFAGVRRQYDLETLMREGGDNVYPVIMDVTEPESLERAKERVLLQPEFRLDGVVNNAGIAVAGPLELLPLAELRRQFEVNFFGAIAVTQTFLPLLRENHGRIVNVSSINGKLATPFAGAYASSKFALEAASDALRFELQPFGVSVSVIEPGAVQTPIWERSTAAAMRLFETVPEDARARYETMVGQALRLTQRMEQRGVPPERVARAIERALFDRHPKARYLVGGDARLRLAVARLPEQLRDSLVRAAFRRAVPP